MEPFIAGSTSPFAAQIVQIKKLIGTSQGALDADRTFHLLSSGDLISMDTPDHFLLEVQ